MKLCKKCNTEKPGTEFNKKNGRGDGLQYFCRECDRAQNRERYQKNRAEIIKKQIAYRKTHPEISKRAIENWRFKNRIKYLAQNRLRNAVKEHKIFKGPCLVCGDSQTHGHHLDYSRPLDVIWLCSQHHKHIHCAEVVE